MVSKVAHNLVAGGVELLKKTQEAAFQLDADVVSYIIVSSQYSTWNQYNPYNFLHWNGRINSFFTLVQKKKCFDKIASISEGWLMVEILSKVKVAVMSEI